MNQQVTVTLLGKKLQARGWRFVRFFDKKLVWKTGVRSHDQVRIDVRDGSWEYLSYGHLLEFHLYPSTARQAWRSLRQVLES